MRTTQYALILITQLVLLCAMYAFGAELIDLPVDLGGTTSVPEGQLPPADQGPGSELRQLFD